MKKQPTSAQLKAAKNGSETALAGIITQELPFIRYFARRAVVPGLDFDDAVQEGLIGLFNAIQQYNPAAGASFRTYAAVCIQNSIYSAQKAAGRKKHAPLNFSIPIPEEQSTPGPEEQTIRNEEVSLTLEKAKTHLSGLERQVLKLFLDGYSYQEIALALNKTTKTVDNALARVRRKLR